MVYRIHSPDHPGYSENTLSTPEKGFVVLTIPIVEQNLRAKRRRIGEYEMPEPVAEISDFLPSDGVSYEKIIVSVKPVIVCDLKALGAATGLGGGSSLTKFHCIYNWIRR